MTAAALLWMPQVSAPVYAAEDDVIYYETGDEAAAALRKAMKERQEKVTIGVHGKTDQEGLRQLIGALLDRATEHTGEPTEGDYINFQYASYKGAAQTTLDGVSPAVEVEYTLEYYDTAEQEKAVDDKVSEIISGMGLGRKTDYEKLVEIYKYICSNTEYDKTEDDSDIRRTSYGALIEGQAVCQGYSLALYRLLLEAGIDNRIIYGKAVQPGGEEGPHTWNIVDLYGKYYYVDITWDDLYLTPMEKYAKKPDNVRFPRNQELAYVHTVDADYIDKNTKALEPPVREEPEPVEGEEILPAEPLEGTQEVGETPAAPTPEAPKKEPGEPTERFEQISIFDEDFSSEE